MCKLGLLQSDKIVLLNFRIIKTSTCHSVRNLAKQIDGVNLTEASRNGVNPLLLFILKEVIEKLQARINTFDHFPFF